MEIRITPRAGRDLDEMWMFVAETAGIAPADNLIDETFEAIRDLRTMADRGRRLLETRGRIIRAVMIRRTWIVIYEAGSGREVNVLRITAARRNLADILKDLG